MVQKYEKRLKDGKYFNKFGIISREIITFAKQRKYQNVGDNYKIVQENG